LDRTEEIGVGIDLDHYLDLIQWTLRVLPGHQTDPVPAALERTLERLSLDSQRWAENVAAYGRLFHSMVGQCDRLTEEARERGQRWFRGKEGSRRLYREARWAA